MVNTTPKYYTTELDKELIQNSGKNWKDKRIYFNLRDIIDLSEYTGYNSYHMQTLKNSLDSNVYYDLKDEQFVITVHGKGQGFSSKEILFEVEEYIKKQNKLV